MSIDKKYLLTESKVFCILPWIHLHVSVEGKVRPCCVSVHHRHFSEIDNKTSLLEHMNSANIQKFRMRMLNDQPSSFCNQCYKHEDCGNNSNRIHMIQNWGHLIDVIDKTNTDTGYISDPILYYLDYRTSNFCNLKCIMCDYPNSSSWFNDNKQFTQYYNNVTPENIIISPIKDKNTIVNSIVDASHAMREMHFAGGEPLIMEEHYALLESLKRNNNTDFQLTYNTNFTKLTYKGTHIFDLWKSFKEIKISMSLDDFGKRGEYIRKGLNWSNIEQNIKLLNEQTFKSLIVKVHSVISVLNIWHITEFHKYMVDSGLVDEHEFMFVNLYYPTQLSTQILPKWFKEQCQSKIEKYLETVHSQSAIEFFTSIINYMNAEDLYNKQNSSKFLNYIESLDRLRNTDYRAILPELEGVFSHKK